MKLPAMFLFAVTATAGALDFRPMVMEGVGEGGKYSYLQFHDHEKAVTYMPPRSWAFHGRDTQLCLVVPKSTGTEIDMSVFAVKKPMPVETANLHAFEELARQSLPAEASKVELVAVDFNPLVIDGHKTIEVIFDYVIFAGPIKVSYLYTAREAEVLCFRVVSRPEDFDPLRQTFKMSLHSFAGL